MTDSEKVQTLVKRAFDVTSTYKNTPWYDEEFARYQKILEAHEINVQTPPAVPIWNPDKLDTTQLSVLSLNIDANSSFFGSDISFTDLHTVGDGTVFFTKDAEKLPGAYLDNSETVVLFVRLKLDKIDISGIDPSANAYTKYSIDSSLNSILDNAFQFNYNMQLNVSSSISTTISVFKPYLYTLEYYSNTNSTMEQVTNSIGNWSFDFKSGIITFSNDPKDDNTTTTIDLDNGDLYFTFVKYVGARGLDKLIEVRENFDKDTALPGYDNQIIVDSDNNGVFLYKPESDGGWTSVGGKFDVSGTDIFYTDGNVGIGTSSPSTNLDVSGSVNVSVSLTVDGSLNVGTMNDVEGKINELEVIATHITSGNTITMFANDVSVNGGLTVDKDLVVDGSLNVGTMIDIEGKIDTLDVSVAALEEIVSVDEYYNVTVNNSNFYINNIEKPVLYFENNKTYRFDQSHSSNSAHPLIISADNSTQSFHNEGDPGTSGAYTQITIDDSTPYRLYYICSKHSGMGSYMQNNIAIVDASISALEVHDIVVDASISALEAHIKSDATGIIIDARSGIGGLTLNGGIQMRGGGSQVDFRIDSTGEVVFPFGFKTEGKCFITAGLEANNSIMSLNAKVDDQFNNSTLVTKYTVANGYTHFDRNYELMRDKAAGSAEKYREYSIGLLGNNGTTASANNVFAIGGNGGPGGDAQNPNMLFAINYEGDAEFAGGLIINRTTNTNGADDKVLNVVKTYTTETQNVLAEFRLGEYGGVSNTAAIINLRSAGQTNDCVLQFGTPYTGGGSIFNSSNPTEGYKGAIVFQGQNSQSRQKFHVCLDDTNSSNQLGLNAYDSGLTKSKMSVDYDGNMVVKKNITLGTHSGGLGEGMLMINNGSVSAFINRIAIYGTTYGFGVNGGTLTYHSGQNHKFYHGSTTTASGTLGMELIKTDTGANLNVTGNIGIGDANPSYKLTVNGTSGNASNLYYLDLENGGILLNLYAKALTGDEHKARVYKDPNKALSIYSSGGIGLGDGGKYYYLSDERIKTNITDISDDEALVAFRKLKPKTYNYKDPIKAGYNSVYGFIAQEVEEVIPNSTMKDTGFIPNIYSICEIDNSANILTFHFGTSGETIELFDLSVNDVIQIEDSSQNMIERTIINIIDETSIQVNDEYIPSHTHDASGIELSCNRIFVYGKKVDDLHRLGKDAIWTVAAAALQEVDRQQQSDKNRIATLETQVTTLETQLSELMARVASLESAA